MFHFINLFDEGTALTSLLCKILTPYRIGMYIINQGIRNNNRDEDQFINIFVVVWSSQSLENTAYSDFSPLHNRTTRR